jgi:hypothetical protein
VASTPEGRRLTEEHRLEQQAVRNEFLAEFIALWALLDSARLDETGPGWVRAVMRLIQGYRIRSAEVATRYYWDFRAAEAPSSIGRPRIPDLSDAPPETPSRPSSPRPGRQQTPRRRRDGFQGRRAPRELERVIERSGVRFDVDERAFDLGERRRATIDIPDIDWKPRDRAVEVSLTVTGPIGQKAKAARGKPAQVARDESFVESSGAASRHVLTGGRQSLLTLVQGDMQAIGWVRVTDGDPCAFCAMLASRGPVFKKGSFAESDPRFTGPGEVKVHDHCACTLEAVYARDQLWPGRAQEFHKLWMDNIHRRYSGAEARRQWRRLIEEMRRENQRGAIA